MQDGIGHPSKDYNASDPKSNGQRLQDNHVSLGFVAGLKEDQWPGFQTLMMTGISLRMYQQAAQSGAVNGTETDKCLVKTQGALQKKLRSLLCICLSVVAAAGRAGSGPIQLPTRG